MLNRIATQILRQAVRKSELNSTRSFYPYSRSMVARFKTPDEMKTPEKLVWTLAAFVVVMSVPGYIMVNLNSYKGVTD